MSEFCAIPGCTSRLGQTTLFGVNSTLALSQWWKNTSWSKLHRPSSDGVTPALSPSQICIAHFRKDHIDRRSRTPRLSVNAVPTLNLPNASGAMSIAAGSSSNSMIIPEPYVKEPPVEHCSPLLMVCRFCSKKQRSPIRNHLEDLVESEELLQLCLGRGRFLEGFPSGVCNQCLQMIRLTSTFIKNCERAQDKLQKMFFGTSQQMVESFEEEVTELDKGQCFAQPFVFPEPDISLQYAEELIIKDEQGNEDPLDEFDDDDTIDDDDESEEDNEDVGTSQNQGLEPGEVRVQTYPMVSKSGIPRRLNPKFASEYSGDIRCTICDRTFNRKRSLKAHMESIHEKRTFECKICGKSMGWRKTLQRHMKAHTENNLKHKCDTCDKVFNRGDHLRLHMRQHTGEKVQCPLCSSGLRCNYKLSEHLNKVHKLDPEAAKMYVRMAVVKV